MECSPVRQLVVIGGRPEWRSIELPPLQPKFLRVRTLFSGVSQGTELLAFELNASPNLPPHPLGYQVAGEVIELGSEVAGGFQVGDHVACYGAPYVSHSQVVDVPYLLAARIPDAMPLPHAAFCGLGAIALHAFRVARLSLGEVAVVIGLGMLGNLIAQFGRIAGCRVVATDLAQSRAEIARSVGIEVAPSWDSLVDRVKDFSMGNGADAVFLAVNRCSEELLRRATELLRLRGRLVIVGTADAQLPREALFAREAELIVSRAGGPGRYDSNYEAACVDYPYGYVRWTEGRNVAEYVRLAAEGALQVTPLLTDLVPVSEFAKTYESLSSAPEKHLGVVFDWREESV